MPANFRPLLAAAVLTAALAACDDPYAVKAQTMVVADTLVLYGLNEAPIGAPTALTLLGAPSRQMGTTANATFGFDLALDVVDAGSVRLLTPWALLGVLPSPASAPHRVGLQIVPDAYDALARAPTTDYNYDSLLTVTPGQTVAIQSANPVGCPVVYLGTSFYAKLVVDSIRPDPARVFLRITTDPNCDFRSLIPGSIPED